MKLIVQIPCYNEEETLPATIRDIPRGIDGVDEIELLVIDDGSEDKTVETARALGVHHIVRQIGNRGLANAFMAGINAALELGADIIVNTDGDNQYYGGDIAKLIEPILAGSADIVVGDRQVETIGHFSPTKKKLQKLGSGVVRRFSQTDVRDTTSGFRAFSREAALKMHVTSNYSYTLETIIDAGLKKMAIANVPVKTNEKLRESRLFKSTGAYIRNSAMTILRTATSKNPLKLFLPFALVFFAVGLFLAIRFLAFYIMGDGGGHVQSLLLAAILLISAFITGMFAVLADAISAQRKVTDEVLYRVKKLEFDHLHEKDIEPQAEPKLRKTRK